MTAAAVTEMGKEFLGTDATVVIGVEAVEDGLGLLRVALGEAGYRRDRIEFLRGQAAVTVGVRGIEALVAALLDLCSESFAGGFTLGLIDFSVAVGVPLGAALLASCPAGITHRLALFFVDLPVLVDVVFDEEIWEVTVTDGAFTSGGDRKAA